MGILESPKEQHGIAQALTGIGLRGLAGLHSVGCERKKEKPSVNRLSQLIAIERCARHSLVARYYRLRAIPQQTLNPEP